MMKKTKLYFNKTVICIIIFLTAVRCDTETCKSKNGDCIGYCNEFLLKIKYHNNTGNTIIGDSIGSPSFILYKKDSVKYYVTSSFDTTSILFPTISGDFTNYVLNIKYSYTNKLGVYNVVVLLNSIEKDTFVINTNDGRKDNVNIYHKGLKVGNIDYNCSSEIIIKNN